MWQPTEGEMVDEKAKRGPADRSQTKVSEAYEINYWAATLGVSRDQLVRTVHKVGPMVEDMKQEARPRRRQGA
jgi:hypothetical protein